MSEENKQTFDPEERAAVLFHEGVHYKNIKRRLSNMSQKGISRVLTSLLFAPLDVFLGQDQEIILRKEEQELLSYCNEVLLDKQRLSEYTLNKSNKGDNDE